ncbi:hypothetical protein BV25DRAFT_1308489 [Artomyces pyxidatus]|uniref:Uncharacterized protein n=1 Tax=Artomyces pyxidatus TaxID=48021 RepID=A0ACB8SPM6_9AGAM|nr:hypothetical protein BV25DRAFT_1308489 [Artomyces pyxidatus]
MAVGQRGRCGWSGRLLTRVIAYVSMLVVALRTSRGRLAASLVEGELVCIVSDYSFTSGRIRTLGCAAIDNVGKPQVVLCLKVVSCSRFATLSPPPSSPNDRARIAPCDDCATFRIRVFQRETSSLLVKSE